MTVLSLFLLLAIAFAPCSSYAYLLGAGRSIGSMRTMRTSLSSMSMSLAEKISSAVTQKFSGLDVTRVTSCWDAFSAGKHVNHYLDEDKQVLQQAECYVQGLRAQPFHEIQQYPWAQQLAANAGLILSELQAYNKMQAAPEQLGVDAEGEWLPARDLLGGAYGPQWKTLGLQDRGVWEESRAEAFPSTGTPAHTHIHTYTHTHIYLYTYPNPYTLYPLQCVS
jgi:hypothetical protein